jgi:hypothetical protein
MKLESPPIPEGSRFLRLAQSIRDGEFVHPGQLIGEIWYALEEEDGFSLDESISLYAPTFGYLRWTLRSAGDYAPTAEYALLEQNAVPNQKVVGAAVDLWMAFIQSNTSLSSEFSLYSDHSFPVNKSYLLWQLANVYRAAAKGSNDFSEVESVVAHTVGVAYKFSPLLTETYELMVGKLAKLDSLSNLEGELDISRLRAQFQSLGNTKLQLWEDALYLKQIGDSLTAFCEFSGLPIDKVYEAHPYLICAEKSD